MVENNITLVELLAPVLWKKNFIACLGLQVLYLSNLSNSTKVCLMNDVNITADFSMVYDTGPPHGAKSASSCLWNKYKLHKYKVNDLQEMKLANLVFLAKIPLLVKLKGEKKNHAQGTIPTFDLTDMPLCNAACVVVLLRWPLIDVNWGVGGASVQHNPVLKTKDKS